MGTAIARWGNSAGIRIPAKVLNQSRFKLGDLVDFAVNAKGNIEIIMPQAEHRRVLAPGRISASEVYENFPAIAPSGNEPAWPDDDMVGAEWDSWSA